VIISAIVLLVAAAIALPVGAALGDAGLPLLWAATAGAPLSLVLLGLGLRRYRPRRDHSSG
jgi:membrane protein implicated in regulation of membrane protease activity